MGGDLWQLPGCKKSERNTCENSLHHLRIGWSFPVCGGNVICKLYYINPWNLSTVPTVPLFFFNFFFFPLFSSFFDQLVKKIADKKCQIGFFLQFTANSSHKKNYM